MPNSQDEVRAAAANEFRRSPALQAEFASEQAYVAYRCAMDRGAARIFAPAVPPKTYTAHSARVDVAAAPAARSSVGASKPPTGTMSVIDAMAEFKRSGRSYIRTDLVAHVASRTGMSLHDASGAIADAVADTHYPVA